jgi:glycosyltransferase involved in cell wall biosynthesis
MKVAVVTPYYKEPTEVLDRCINSVKAQTHPDVFHVLVSDGHPSVVTEHTILSPNTGDMGDTPRLIGSAYASAIGADAIIFLDADCWLDPDHVEKLIEAQKVSGALILTNPRKIWCKFTDEYFGVDTESDGIDFNDTNCYFIMRPMFKVISGWGFKTVNKGLIGDRFFWEACIRSGASIGRTTQTMTNYPSDFVCHYEMFCRPIPPDAKIIKYNGETFVHVRWKDK